MRKESVFTIVEQAVVLVPEFEKVVRKLEQQVGKQSFISDVSPQKHKNL